MNFSLSPQQDSYPIVPADPLAEIARLLDDPQTISEGFRQLAADLTVTRAARPAEDWRDFTRAFQDHPLLKTLHQDAFTARGFRKPRGYAGDAVLIDMVYGSGEGELLLAKATALGQRLYQTAMTVPIIAATRGRRDLLAFYIDEVCEERPQAHILSVACGHLREAGLSKAFERGRIGRFTGLDQDRRSLRVAERSLSGVECVAASIDEITDESLSLGRFDFVYAAGLYDYLDDETGRRLLHSLARLVNPGGRILIANFIPDVSGVGYMEAAMDWWLIYRRPEQLLALSDQLPAAVSKRAFSDSLEHLAYLDLRF